MAEDQSHIAKIPENAILHQAENRSGGIYRPLEPGPRDGRLLVRERLRRAAWGVIRVNVDHRIPAVQFFVDGTEGWVAQPQIAIARGNAKPIGPEEICRVFNFAQS